MRAMASAKVAAMIPPGSGIFSLIQNMRWGDTGVLTVKSGTVVQKLGGDPVQVTNSGTIRSFANLTVGGQPQYSFTSFKYHDPSPLDPLHPRDLTDVYWTSNHQVYNLMTSATGKGGDTRLASELDTLHDYETSYQVVNDRFTGHDCVIIQNGFDVPRVWDTSYQRMAKHQPIHPPSRSNEWGATLEWRSYFIVNDYHYTTYSGSPTNFSLDDSDGATVGNNAIRLHQTTSDPSGSASVVIDHAVNNIDNPAGVLDGTNCRQLALVIKPVSGEVAVSHFLQNFKISIEAGGNPYVLVDPSTTFQQAVVVPADLNNRVYVVACSLDGVVEADLSSITTLTIEAIDNAIHPTHAYDLDILCVAATGSVPGNASYALTYFNFDSRSESYEQTLATKTKQIQSMGSRYLSQLTIPDSELLYYQTEVYFQNPTDEEMQSGTDYIRVYRKQLSVDPAKSEPEYTHVASVDIARYNDPDLGSGWKFTQGKHALEIRSTKDNVAPEDRTLWLTSPGAFQQPIPVARCMTFAGNRLICGARAEVQDSFPRVCASAAGMPFRFSSLPFDTENIAAPFEQEVSSENLQAFSVASSSSLGTNAVFVFTDQAVWMLNLMAVGTPNLLSREMSVGTGSPFSIAERHGRIYFLDTDRQVRLIAGDNYAMQDPTGLVPSSGEMPAPLSRGIVDDVLKAIPAERTRAILGRWFNNRYYLFYTPASGTTNTRCLVFSEHANAWESNDLFPTYDPDTDSNMSVEGAMSWRTTTSAYAVHTEPRLIVISSNAFVYQVEVPGVAFQQDADWSNTDIPIALNTGDAHEALWSGLHVKGLGLLADDQNNRSLTGTITYKPTGGTSDFHLSLAAPVNPYQWTVQRTQSAGANGIAATVSFHGSAKGESKFYAFKMEVEPREMMAPTSSPTS